MQKKESVKPRDSCIHPYNAEDVKISIWENFK